MLISRTASPDSVEAAATAGSAVPASSAAPAASAVRRELAAAALDLFESNTYEATTVDAIAARVGVNRRTFFRYFAAKDDAVFADQSARLLRLREALEAGAGEPVAVAAQALAAMLDEILLNGDLLRRRHALIGITPALADRELVWWGEYQHVLGEYLGRTATEPRGQMFAMIIAAALLAAFRQVIAAYLHAGETDDPRALFAELADDITESMSGSGARGSGPVPGHPDLPVASG